MLTGVVERFDKKKGFGFIKPDGGGENVYMHASKLQGFLKTSQPLVGLKVKYDVTWDEQVGKYACSSVKKTSLFKSGRPAPQKLVAGTDYPIGAMPRAGPRRQPLAAAAAGGHARKRQRLVFSWQRKTSAGRATTELNDTDDPEPMLAIEDQPAAFGADDHAQPQETWSINALLETAANASGDGHGPLDATKETTAAIGADEPHPEALVHGTKAFDVYHKRLAAEQRAAGQPQRLATDRKNKDKAWKILANHEKLPKEAFRSMRRDAQGLDWQELLNREWKR